MTHAGLKAKKDGDTSAIKRKVKPRPIQCTNANDEEEITYVMEEQSDNYSSESYDENDENFELEDKIEYVIHKHSDDEGPFNEYYDDNGLKRF